ncbi:MAG: hypothetical protein JKY02_08050 [Flavobacteriaceae bacterium]|nr:hypothetical protein [Flavobacteriaceae bacterium]
MKAILSVLDYDFSKIQYQDFKEISIKEKQDNFKTNWFQEPKEKYVFIIPILVTICITLSFLFIDFPILSVLIIGGFLGFSFPFYAGFTQRNKHVLKRQLEEKKLVRVGFSLMKFLGLTSLYVVLIIYYVWNIYPIPNDIENFTNSNWISVGVFGFASLLIFFFTLKLIIKVFNKKFGLTINENGVTDHSSVISFGFIPWSDIQNIEVRSRMFNLKSIKLILKNPEDYINKYKKRSLKRKRALEDYNRFDSPIQLHTTLLKINPSQLYNVLNHKFQEHMDKEF